MICPILRGDCIPEVCAWGLTVASEKSDACAIALIALSTVSDVKTIVSMKGKPHCDVDAAMEWTNEYIGAVDRGDAE